MVKTALLVAVSTINIDPQRAQLLIRLLVHRQVNEPEPSDDESQSCFLGNAATAK